jgi:hypothetical protein
VVAARLDRSGKRPWEGHALCLRGPHVFCRVIVLAVPELFSPWVNSCCFGFLSLEGGRLARSVHFTLVAIYHLVAMRKAIDRPGIDAIMSLYRARECTDPRDKMFGFLGLMMGAQVNLITPDCSASVSQTFEQTTIQLIQHYQDLRILRCGLLRSGPFKSLPSWVPDWTSKGTYSNYRDIRLRADRLEFYNSTAGSCVSTHSLCTRRLVLLGRLLATVESLGECYGKCPKPTRKIIRHGYIFLDSIDTLAACIPRLENQKMLRIAGSANTITSRDAFRQTLSAALVPAHSVITKMSSIVCCDADKHRTLHNA